MRASRRGAAFVVLLGGVAYSAALSPAEARSGERQGAHQQAAAIAARAVVPTAAARAQPTKREAAQQGARATAAPSSILRPAVLVAPQPGAQGRGEATRSGSGISCVPFARQASGIEIFGNGREWWHNAAGLYERGNLPEVGSVLVFPASGGMHLGHVSVVSRVVSGREILVDHANWAGPGIRRGTVMREVSVIDVSPGNDWTQVRVQVGWSAGTYGRVYPSHGFIYNRPDPTAGTLLAGRSRGGPRLASTAERSGGARQGSVELAEQPAEGDASPHARGHLDLSIRILETSLAR
jgi:surface antigen